MGTFTNIREQTARKEHRCYGCGGGVEKGEKYISLVGVYEGDFVAIKYCLTCWSF
jgi:hypothetical protein